LKWYDLASYTSGQDEGKQTSLSTNKKDYVLPLGIFYRVPLIVLGGLLFQRI